MLVPCVNHLRAFGPRSLRSRSVSARSAEHLRPMTLHQQVDEIVEIHHDGS